MLKKALLATTFAIAASSSAQAQSLLTENFDNVSTLAAKGWVFSNLSSPAGTNWFQGNPAVFAAQSGAPSSYVAANYASAANSGPIDNWLISPTFSTAVAGTVSFYVKAEQATGYADSLSFGFGSGSGSAPSSFASMVSVTPVASQWTLYTLKFAAQGAGSVGRFAFEYTGTFDSSDYVGVDTFSVTSVPSVPEPGSWMVLAVGLAGIGWVARRKV